MACTTEKGSTRSRPQGVVLWRGRSLIDGKPIAAVATGLQHPSANRATGPVVQVWIIRAFVLPLDAVRRGGDRSTCGDCMHRGQTCYVQVWREVTQVYRNLRRGLYPDYEPRMLACFRGRAIRFGAYGDPAAVPIALAQRLRPVATLWLSYTHHWEKPWCDPGLREFCMASVDSAEQRERALALGWKTFRIRAASEAVLPGEFVCPKSPEAGHRLQCIQCGACNGGQWTGEATPVTILHSGLPHQRERFFGDARRFPISLPLVGQELAL